MTNELILTYDANINQTFSTYTATPFNFTGDIVIDYGDGATETINANKKILHTYNDNNTYIITITGNITGLMAHCLHACSGLINVIIPSSVNTLEEYCFFNCSNITSINFPSSIITIGENCFYNCSSLTSIDIPSSVTTLGRQCFMKCTGLTNITIPSSIINIEDNCFYDCTALNNVNISQNTTTLGHYWFYGCSNLTNIIIPSSITNIGNGCFRNCSALINYQLYWEISPISYDSSKMPNNTNTIFNIPHGTTQLYINAGYPSTKLVERVPTCQYDNNLDISSLNGSLVCLGKRLVHHLTEMGVENVSYDDGLTTLVDKILTIQRTINVPITTSITLTKNQTTVYNYDNITLTAILHADYDDTSITNNDLNGYIQGATLTLYDGDNAVTTAVTNQDGVAIFNINSIAYGSHTYSVVYDGTDDFDMVTSNILNFTAEHKYNLNFSKESYNQNDINVPVILTDNNVAVANETITLTDINNNTFTAVTNQNGTATFTVTGCAISIDNSGSEYTASFGLITETATIEGILMGDNESIDCEDYINEASN